MHITCTLNFLCDFFIKKLLVNGKCLVTSYDFALQSTKCAKLKQLYNIQWTKIKTNFKHGLEYIR